MEAEPVGGQRAAQRKPYGYQKCSRNGKESVAGVASEAFARWLHRQRGSIEQPLAVAYRFSSQYRVSGVAFADRCRCRFVTCTLGRPGSCTHNACLLAQFSDGRLTQSYFTGARHARRRRRRRRR